MIIELHSSLIKLSQNSATELAMITEKLELLWFAHREGHHIIFSEIDTAEELIKVINPANSSAISLLQRLVNQYPKNASLAYQLQRKLLIGDFSEKNLQLTNQIIQCPVSLINSNIIQKTVLLVENLSDAIFYEWITKKTLLNDGLGSLNLQYEGYLGGGNTTAEAYAHIKKNTSRLCLCIVDSDIRAPGVDVGLTAKKVLNEDIKNPSPRAFTHVIGACSIENLIPFKAFEIAWKNNIDLAPRLATYKAHHREEHWRYLQLKKHITCFETHGQTEFSKYWNNALKDAEQGCNDKACHKKSDCNSYKLMQLSSAPLTSTFDYLQEMPFDTNELLSDILLAWKNIAQDVLNWCCAPAPSAVA